jgi:hypothetical protein
MASVGGNVEGRVAVEESDWLQPKPRAVHRHDRPVLGAGLVKQAEHVPEDDVGVLDGSIGRGPCRQTRVRAALRDELAARPALVLMERRDPEVVSDRLRDVERR